MHTPPHSPPAAVRRRGESRTPPGTSHRRVASSFSIAGVQTTDARSGSASPPTPATVARSHFQRSLHAEAAAQLRPTHMSGWLTLVDASERRWFQLRDGVLTITAGSGEGGGGGGFNELVNVQDIVSISTARGVASDACGFVLTTSGPVGMRRMRLVAESVDARNSWLFSFHRSIATIVTTLLNRDRHRGGRRTRAAVSFDGSGGGRGGRRARAAVSFDGSGGGRARDPFSRVKFSASDAVDDVLLSRRFGGGYESSSSHDELPPSPQSSSGGGLALSYTELSLLGGGRGGEGAHRRSYGRSASLSPPPMPLVRKDTIGVRNEDAATAAAAAAAEEEEESSGCGVAELKTTGGGLAEFIARQAAQGFGEGGTEGGSGGGRRGSGGASASPLGSAPPKAVPARQRWVSPSVMRRRKQAEEAAAVAAAAAADADADDLGGGGGDDIFAFDMGEEEEEEVAPPLPKEEPKLWGACSRVGPREKNEDRWVAVDVALDAVGAVGAAGVGSNTRRQGGGAVVPRCVRRPRRCSRRGVRNGVAAPLRRRGAARGGGGASGG